MKQQSEILWLDLGSLGAFLRPSYAHDKWQDHGLGLLRTIMHQQGVMTDLASVRMVAFWKQLEPTFKKHRILLMNVRSYNYECALKASRLFKKVNPSGVVIVGGMHCTVAPEEMKAAEVDVIQLGRKVVARCFDWICQGSGEKVIVNLVENPTNYPLLIKGDGSKSLSDWPQIDRTLWPRPWWNPTYPWPLEPKCGWGPGPVATVITSRVCPWQCSFCNENSFIPNMGRRSVDQVIDELNFLDRKHGPLGSVVIHDSMFFQNPPYLKEWLGKYPRKTRKAWPYWAAGRADTIRKWPDLFEALVKETNWRAVSVGFESGSDKVLRILNKECTAEDNYFAIELLNRIGDEMEREGKEPPWFWSNIMLGIPGETKEDAFQTMAMMRSMRRAKPSLAYYAAYPGGALGEQLIAEGKSLNTGNDRNPNSPKIKGVDYDFLNDLRSGKYEREVRHAQAKRQAVNAGFDAERMLPA